MKRIAIILLVLTVFASVAWSQMEHGMMGRSDRQSYSQEEGEKLFELMSISRGGQLYDNWWKATVDTKKPENDHPLWKEQSSNQRGGYDTYRCKECHGWDYRGKNGAYGKGSHYTGFKGVYEAAEKMSIKELEDVNKGVISKKHDFTAQISNKEIADLALFIKKGLIDTGKFVDGEGLPIGGNKRAGRHIFKRNCAMCHGAVGTEINFGDSEKPEFLGTVAYNNPWEFIHKVRNGQPGTRMPSAIINDWSEEDILDLLSFVRTLPKDTSEISWWSRRFGGGMQRHHRMMHGDGHLSGERGFGASQK
ncbi:MAG: cytochrome c [Nitrospinae bacterium]|nr:cytochrome c [Nitrospinota bacterium]